MSVVAFKVLLAIVTAALGVWVLRRPALANLSERRFLWLALGLQAVPAVVVFILLFVIGSQLVPSDVPGFYLPTARSVLAGQIPYRDFHQSYAPLFPYVGAALAFVWNDARVFPLFAIALNAVALVLWHGAARAWDSNAARQSSILYATSGHVLVQALLGTNQTWIAAALAGSTWLVVRGAGARAGLVQALAASCTKLLAFLFWPVIWICVPRRARWLAVSTLLTAAVYALFASAGADLLDPVRRESDLFSSGNLPFVLEPLLASLGSTRYLPLDALALAALAGATGWQYLQARPLLPQQRPQLLLPGLALVGLVFMIFSKKSYTGYAVFFMYPAILVLCLARVDARARAGFLLAFNVLLAAEPSLWFRVGRWRPLSEWLGQPDAAGAAAFVILDIALVGSYAYLAWLSVRCIQRIVRDCAPRTTAGAIALRNANQSATA